MLLQSRSIDSSHSCVQSCPKPEPIIKGGDFSQGKKKKRDIVGPLKPITRTRTLYQGGQGPASPPGEEKRPEKF
jgi:hypothetical protein